jgi:galactose mutarotase-like enzyme
MTGSHPHLDRTGSVDEHRFAGEPAITLTSGDLSATFLPGLGMTGVSLRWQGREHLAVPGGLAALRRGSTLGLPLLAPWANRLSRWQYTAAGVDVDLTGLPLHTDGQGLPIHGLLVGSGDWRVGEHSTGRGRASLAAAVDVDAPAFPFAHRITVTFTVLDAELQVTTTVTPTGDRSVPVAFGWHPYLQLPAGPRPGWRLAMPPCTHVLLDERGIPTGDEAPQPAAAEPIGLRTFDDLYRLDGERAFSVADDESAITMRAGAGYAYAQVWVPAGRPFVALEPMVARTDGLVDGSVPVVRPGEAYTAEFTVAVGPATPPAPDRG